jgi:cell division protein FtsB
VRAQADAIDAVRTAEVRYAKGRLRIGFWVAMLALLCLMVFSFVFPTAKLYMTQQLETERLRAEVEAAASLGEELEAQLARWEDPAYVKAQARERLSFAMPGDRSFRVSDPENAPELAPVQTPQADVRHLTDLDQPDDDPPWYAQLWDSVVVAGNVG